MFMSPTDLLALIALFRRFVFLPDDVHWQRPYPALSVLVVRVYKMAQKLKMYALLPAEKRRQEAK